MVSWCDLHPDLLRKIVHRLNNAVDAIHFRSLCRSWRNYLHPPAVLPYQHLPLPAEGANAKSPALIQNTVWSLQQSTPPQSPNSTSSSTGALILFNVAENGRRSILNPILQETGQVQSSSTATNPWILNFLHFRVYERDRFYMMYERKPMEGYSKALVFPSSSSIWSKSNDLAVLALFMRRVSKNLRLWKYRDQTWTVVESSTNSRTSPFLKINYDNKTSDTIREFYVFSNIIPDATTPEGGLELQISNEDATTPEH